VTFLTGLHGSLATILICVLLIVDEAGVPMWIAPNEVLLLIAGFLIASGAESPVIFIPAAILAQIGGSWTGYSWAKAAGSTQLQSIADRLKAGRAYQRAVRRIGAASTRQIFVSRLIPGIRPYATLAAGAAEVDFKRFMAANVPAIVVWVFLLTGVGYLVGVPAVHLVSDVEKLAISGALFVILGILAYRVLRRAPHIRDMPNPGPFHGIARRDRYGLALACDAGAVAVIAAGFDRITRSILGVRLPLLANNTIFEPLTILAVVALTYLVISRRTRTGETAGERLFDVSYVHPRLASSHRGGPEAADRPEDGAESAGATGQIQSEAADGERGGQVVRTPHG